MNPHALNRISGKIIDPRGGSEAEHDAPSSITIPAPLPSGRCPWPLPCGHWVKGLCVGVCVGGRHVVLATRPVSVHHNDSLSAASVKSYI